MRLRNLPGFWAYFDRDGDGGDAPPPADGAPPPADTPPADSAPPPQDTPPAPAFDYGKWAEGLNDAGKKDYAKRFKSVDEVLDGALNLRKEMSSRVKVPGEKAKPEEVEAFRKAIGADPDPAKYEVTPPEGVQLGDIDKAFLGAAQQIAAENGVPVSVFKAQAGEHFKLVQQIQEKVAAEVAQYEKDAVKRLKTEHGTDYDKRLVAGNALIDKIDKTGEVRAFLDDTVTWNGVSIKVGSHPALVNVLAELGLRMGEDGVLGGNTESENTNIDKQIRDLEAKHPIGQRTREQDAEIAALYRKRYPS
jgi:hypothetical protein